MSNGAGRDRSRIMSGIRAKDTVPELTVRRFLHSHGFRYRLHRRSLPGKPDLVLRRYKVAVLVHGCFWHRHLGCKYAATPATRREFWLQKLEGNRDRDLKNQSALLNMGWRVVIVWECALKHSQESTLRALREFIVGSQSYAELSSQGLITE